jgi:hypothetical protein
MSNPATIVSDLHRLYVSHTGLQVSLNMAREVDWGRWLQWRKPPFTADDLRAVVDHIRRGIRDGARNPGALKFRNLIGMPDYFEEDLAEATARSRVPRIDPCRADALKATGRDPQPAPNPERSAAEVLASEAFQEFCKLKETL